MHTARNLPCQPGCPRAVGAGTLLTGAALLLAAFLLLPSSGAAAGDQPPPVPAVSPSPTPPAWQQDLNALAVMRVAAALAPDKATADGKTPAQHLADAYRQLGGKYPNQPEIQKACGDFSAEIGEKAAAFGYWLRAQELDPRNADVAATLGSAYLRTGDTRGAASQFQRAVDAKPDEADYQTDLANVLYLFRHDLVNPPALPDAEAVLRQALEHFRLAARLSPKNRGLAQAYAETFYTMAQPDWGQALDAWRIVLALSGDDPDFANSHLARVSLRMKRPQEAEAYLDQLHRPDFVDLQTRLRAQAKKMESGPETK